jgi:hypothetical protein
MIDLGDREAESAVIIEQRGHHRLSFLPSDLPDRLGQCLDCGQRMDIEEWNVSRCPGETR